MQKWKRFFPYLGLIILIGGLFVGWYTYSLFQPVATSDQALTRFVIAKGESVTGIANQLYEQHFIKHPLVFKIAVKQQGLDNKIQAGSFEISPNMNPFQIAQVFTKGTEDIWITIPEGWRVEEIADMAARQELPEFSKTEFLDLAAGEEGYLFPDTYLIPRETTAQQLFTLLTSTFDKKIKVGLATEIADSDRSFDQVMIMASIVQREAKVYDQQRHVAGILWHRIAIGMPLQVDATLQYVKGYSQSQDDWWVTPTAADKEMVSPFNTYLNMGLPPRPICNPGLDAIKATLDPISTDDLFYIHDETGVMHYAQTLDEHNQNVNTYLR